MPAEARAILVKRAQVLLAQLAKRPERHVKSARGMPLGQHELVARPEDPMVQHQEQVKAREIAADMPDSTLIMHSEESSLAPSRRSSQDRVELFMGSDAATGGNTQGLESREP